MMATVPGLPLELIYHIISFVLPPDARTLVPASHITTRTLLALTTVSRGVYHYAARKLHQHCAYLDSAARLARFLACLEAQRMSTPLYTVHGGVEKYGLSKLTQLYISITIDDPSSSFSSPSSSDSELAFQNLCALLHHISPTLKRLIIDVSGLVAFRTPTNRLIPDAKRTVKIQFLRAALASLARLEEIVDIYDDYGRGDWWAESLPCLRRLALAANCSGEFRAPHRIHGSLARLEMVVCVPGKVVGPSAWGVPLRWIGESLPCKVLFVNTARRNEATLQRILEGGEKDPSFSLFDVPMSYYGDEDEDWLCQAWLRRGALRGDLWEWEGTPASQLLAERRIAVNARD
jgi:hypothetical protein